ncbi:MAG TPA: DUF6807 family protein [Gemmataceae bacterium]|jgi:hypothetical protein|nr:DUF6807 family protein [Gemmataceae bacterium]
MPAFRLSLLALVLSATPLFADWNFEVTGGKEDLHDVLVSLPLPEKTEVPTAVSVSDAIGTVFVAQVMPAGGPGSNGIHARVVALMPLLKSGETNSLQVKPATTNDSKHKSFEWKLENGRPLELSWHEEVSSRRVLSFVGTPFDPKATPTSKQALENPTIKPYHHVFDPATGKVQLTNGPTGQYPHHRGVFYGFNKISYDSKTADTWHCRNGESTVAGEKHVAKAGPLFGLHRFPVNWNGPDGKPFAEELRQLTVFQFSYYGNVKGTLIDFTSELRTSRESGVKLDGDPQHAGFHFRANSAMEKDTKNTYFLRPDGKGELGVEKNWDPKTKKGPVNLPWDAMSFMLEGKRYTVLYLDHPSNPKEARQSERCYGRIGTYFEHQLTPQKPLIVHYRLWIQEGEMTVEQCDALSKSFTQEVKVVAK